MNAAPLPAPRSSSTTRRLGVRAALLTLLLSSPAVSTANAADAPGAAPALAATPAAPAAEAAAPAAEAAAPAVAASAAPAMDKLKFTAAWRSRYEVWDFFAPSGGAGANNTYDFYGTDLRASATWTDKYFEAMVEGQAVGLVDLEGVDEGVLERLDERAVGRAPGVAQGDLRQPGEPRLDVAHPLLEDRQGRAPAHAGSRPRAEARYSPVPQSRLIGG